VTESAPAAAPAPEVAAASVAESTTDAVEAAPKKTATSRKKKSKSVTATPVQASVAAVSSVDPIQALVDAAIAKTTPKEETDQDGSGSQTFATDYLVVPATQGRRRPGPSLSSFKDMAMTMGRR
ncbi:MAG: hypothetical protein AB4042_19080, partial [Leptolyngbyaceae cyanobacterium]